MGKLGTTDDLGVKKISGSDTEIVKDGVESTMVDTRSREKNKVMCLWVDKSYIVYYRWPHVT